MEEKAGFLRRKLLELDTQVPHNPAKQGLDKEPAGLDMARRKTDQIPKTIPEPADKRGYTEKEIRAIFGSSTKAMLDEMRGCTAQIGPKGEMLIPASDVLRASDALRGGHSRIPWD